MATYQLTAETAGAILITSEATESSGFLVQGVAAGVVLMGAEGSFTPNVVARSAGAIEASIDPDLDIDEYTGDLVIELMGVDTATFTLDGQKMSLDRVMTQIYNVWGMEVKSARDITFARPRVLEIVNGAMQIIYSRAKELDYFSKVPGMLEFDADQSNAPMPANMQNLLGDVRTLTGKLKGATSREEFESWSTIYFGGNSASTPRVYWLEKQANVDGFDSASATLHIAPAPTVLTEVYFDYAQEAPYFTETAFLRHERLQMPHSYVETLLLPICKYRASSDNLFRGDQSLRQALASEYQTAMQQLGMVDPDTAPTQQTRKGAMVPK